MHMGRTGEPQDISPRVTSRRSVGRHAGSTGYIAGVTRGYFPVSGTPCNPAGTAPGSERGQNAHRAERAHIRSSFRQLTLTASTLVVLMSSSWSPSSPSLSSSSSSSSDLRSEISGNVKTIKSSDPRAMTRKWQAKTASQVLYHTFSFNGPGIRRPYLTDIQRRCSVIPKWATSKEQEPPCSRYARTDPAWLFHFFVCLR